MIASVVTSVLLVVESGRTRTSAATEAIHRLKAAGATILGVALTKSSTNQSGYGYGYGYGYGRYGYGKGSHRIGGDRSDVVNLIE